MTEPLTPPDCDLRGLPFMPLDVIRVLDSDLFAISTGEEFKAAIALWCKSWLQVPAASLPSDDRILAHLSGAGPRWKKIKEVALRGFVKCSDGRFYHPVVAEKALDAWNRRAGHSEKQSSKSERQQRWRQRQKELSERLREIGVAPPKGASLETLERLLGDSDVDGKASTSASTVDAREMPKTGTGTGTVIPLGKPNGASTENPPDPDKQFWDNAKAYLGKSKGGVIGKWCRDYGQEATAKAITASQIARAVDPVPFIERTLRNARSGAEELPIV
jgi:hypothetical protein